MQIITQQMLKQNRKKALKFTSGIDLTEPRAPSLGSHLGRVQGWESVWWGVLGIPLLENNLLLCVYVLTAIFMLSIFSFLLFIYVFIVFSCVFSILIPIFIFRFNCMLVLSFNWHDCFFNFQTCRCTGFQLFSKTRFPGVQQYVINVSIILLYFLKYFCND